MKTILKKEEKQSVDEVLNFAKSLNVNEQEAFKSWISGYEFATQLYKGKEKQVN